MPASLAKVLANRGAAVKAPQNRTDPLWKGPAGEGPLGGITFSMLSKYLVCKERFRLYAIEGLRTVERFEAMMEFGSMWHAAEEALARTGKTGVGATPLDNWGQSLADYCNGLLKKYPLDQDKVAHWYSFAEAMFPLYVEHWRNHPDVINRTPVFQEQVFDEKYTLPSGRFVRLRGKFDSVDVITEGKKQLLYIQENKTKSQIDSVKIGRQVSFDLQTMMYIVALLEVKESAFWNRSHKKWRNTPIGGVRYNVIRRSAHKSVESLVKKLTEDQEDGRIKEWFDRWKIDIAYHDVERFQRECLNPILENLLDDYEWWAACCNKANALLGASIWDYERRAKAFPEHRSRHFVYPYGIYNILNEGGQADVDSYMMTGSEVGLRRVNFLFPELQDAQAA